MEFYATNEKIEIKIKELNCGKKVISFVVGKTERFFNFEDFIKIKSIWNKDKIFNFNTNTIFDELILDKKTDYKIKYVFNKQFFELMETLKIKEVKLIESKILKNSEIEIDIVDEYSLEKGNININFISLKYWNNNGGLNVVVNNKKLSKVKINLEYLQQHNLEIKNPLIIFNIKSLDKLEINSVHFKKILNLIEFGTLEYTIETVANDVCITDKFFDVINKKQLINFNKSIQNKYRNTLKNKLHFSSINEIRDFIKVFIKKYDILKQLKPEFIINTKIKNSNEKDFLFNEDNYEKYKEVIIEPKLKEFITIITKKFEEITKNYEYNKEYIIDFYLENFKKYLPYFKDEILECFLIDEIKEKIDVKKIKTKTKKIIFDI